MTAVWIIFTLVLFVLEPLVLHRLFLKKAEQAPEKTFVVIQVMHWVLLTISLATVAGAVAGSHGWLLE
jgi:peptidoglycan biosynthesis protein MviN/MurJ (putative lipid II flippase)